MAFNLLSQAPPAMLAPLTPEEERQLAAMQQQLAAPPPVATPPPPPAPAAGPALAAMAPAAPAPSPTPAVGPAMRDMQGPVGFVLPAILATGGDITREVYQSLSPIERDFLDRLPAGKLDASKDLSNAFNSYADDIMAQTPRNIALPDGRTVTMVNNQIVPDQRQAKPEIITGEDGTQFFADPATATAVPIMANGQPVRKEARLSVSQTNQASLYQGMLDSSNARFQSLNGLPETQKVSWNEETQTYSPSMFGTSVKAERDKLLREQKTYESKLETILTPTTRRGEASPAATPTPSPYTSPDDVRAALRAGKIDRAAAIGILRSQFNYK